MQVAGGFVRPVYINRDLVHAVEIQHGYAVALEAIGGGVRAGHGAVDPVLDLGQGIDEIIGGAAGADTNHRSGFNIGNRRHGDVAFLFVLRHALICLCCRGRHYSLES